MGPYPHDGPPQGISAHNPAGTDGFAFVEFGHPEPERLETLFCAMGFVRIAHHRTKPVSLYRQGDISFLVNTDPNSYSARFVARHGPSVPAMAWRVADPARAFAHATAHGAEPYQGTDRTVDFPAIRGIGGSLIYFVRQTAETVDTLAGEFEFARDPERAPRGHGFTYLDHLTHNVHRGNMDKWFGFYRDIFKFRQIRFFDIEGRLTGLTSRALTSPCGKIRIPVNESADENSQIEEYLAAYKGEGIQHLALGTSDLYRATDRLAEGGISFMPPPPDGYYDASHARVPGHNEPLDLMKRHGILIDGEGVVDGGETKILLQVFSKTVIGPVFFEFIQRKGDDGFGEGNFRALFEAIEQDQIDRGVLKTDAA